MEAEISDSKYKKKLDEARAILSDFEEGPYAEAIFLLFSEKSIKINKLKSLHDSLRRNLWLETIWET